MNSGDIVIAIDGARVKWLDDVVGYLASHTSVGDEVSLTVVRDGKEIAVGVMLEERPAIASPGSSTAVGPDDCTDV